jgi:hypothetical protein
MSYSQPKTEQLTDLEWKELAALKMQSMIIQRLSAQKKWNCSRNF